MTDLEFADYLVSDAQKELDFVVETANHISKNIYHCEEKEESLEDIKKGDKGLGEKLSKNMKKVGKYFGRDKEEEQITDITEIFDKVSEKAEDSTEAVKKTAASCMKGYLLAGEIFGELGELVMHVKEGNYGFDKEEFTEEEEEYLGNIVSDLYSLRSRHNMAVDIIYDKFYKSDFFEPLEDLEVDSEVMKGVGPAYARRNIKAALEETNPKTELHSELEDILEDNIEDLEWGEPSSEKKELNEIMYN